MARHIVARTSEIPPGGNKVVDVDGRDIVVFHVNGEFFALLNRCPHEGAPLDKAACVARLTSPEPGVYQRSRVGELLRCAWHGWEFDMRNGQSWFDPKRVKVRTYPVVDRGRRDAGQGPLCRRDLSGPRRGQLRHRAKLGSHPGARRRASQRMKAAVARKNAQATAISRNARRCYKAAGFSRGGRMSKQSMREEAERLIRETMERKAIVVKQGNTRIEAVCGKCGAPNRVFGRKRRDPGEIRLQAMRPQAGDAVRAPGAVQPT